MWDKLFSWSWWELSLQAADLLRVLIINADHEDEVEDKEEEDEEL